MLQSEHRIDSGKVTIVGLDKRIDINLLNNITLSHNRRNSGKNISEERLVKSRLTSETIDNLLVLQALNEIHVLLNSSRTHVEGNILEDFDEGTTNTTNLKHQQIH